MMEDDNALYDEDALDDELESVSLKEISDAEVGQRLDRYVVSLLKNVSRAAVQQLIDSGLILINGKTSKSGYALRLHDEVQVLASTPIVQTRVEPKDMPLDVVYEDTDVIVINKAPGMVVHPAAGHYEDTLVNALLARYPELRDTGNEQRPGIVHRLDKDTSGLMIIARTTRALAALTEMMKQHEIVKRYLALVEGTVSLDQGSIDAPIGRDPRNRQQMAITTKDSREARTHFRVLQRFARHTLLLLQLETGRTHQIRVHLKAIGHPVVGDAVYGSSNIHHHIKLQRQFLHAYQLKFTHPITGQVLELEAPLPSDLQAALDAQNVI